jgi:predicted peptidase
LFTPSQSGKQPLLVFLHGMEERGVDDGAQLRYGFFGDSRSLFGAATLAEHPAFVLAPQCPPEDTWVAASKWSDPPRFSATPTRAMAGVISLIESLVTTHPVDLSRIYVAGLSMGGFGALDLAARRPDLVAAAVAVCGGFDLTEARRLANTSLFLLHGALDKGVPVAFSRDLAGVLPARYKEYADLGHNVWDIALAEPDVIAWLFAQRRTPVG